MNQNQPPHARAFDLPGWPCPPRLGDIRHHEQSWGWVPVDGSELDVQMGRAVLAQDELGYLWVKGSAVPVFRTPNEASAHPGALVFWTGAGIGLWVHSRSLSDIPCISRLDMDTEDWLPVNAVSAEWPPFIKATA
jgi:hypothetical protein